MAPTPRPRRLRLAPIALGALSLALYALWYALLIAAPTASAWVASSLAAHAGGSMRVAALSALWVFPVLPVGWEALAAWRRSRLKVPRRRFLTLGDRLVLRTLAVSVIFLTALLARSPTRAFAALNSRGDWMLDGRHDPQSERLRRGIFRVAAGSAWLYRLADDNPFHHGHARPHPRPLPSRGSIVVDGGPPNASPVPETVAPPAPPRDPHAWPQEATLSAVVQGIPAANEVSPETVGHYLAAHTADRWALARAVHDYVADRVAYDVVSYRSGTYPPQDAATTFRTRLSVCAGYAALFEAIGTAAGLEVVTVVGRARNGSSEGMGEGHAWNALKLDGRWYLTDTTWDAGSVDATGFHKALKTSYFLTPPEVFVLRHLPDEARWQLLASPRTEGEFMRAPLLRPEFFAYGLRLRSPDRAEVDARGEVRVVIDNPEHVSLMARVAPEGTDGVECDVRGTDTITARCPLPAEGASKVIVFANRTRVGTHWSVGEFFVHSR